MTNPTDGEWQHVGKYIFSEHGNICILSDPRMNDNIGDAPLTISSLAFGEAMANGKLIIEAVKAYRQILQLFGENWRDELAKWEKISEEL